MKADQIIEAELTCQCGVYISIHRQTLRNVVDMLGAAESKLAELEMQESAKEDSRNYDKKKCCDVVTISVPIGLKLYCNAKSSEAVQDAKSKESFAQRITEQDAYKIISSFANIDLGGLDHWLEVEEGRSLLAKLNEHREPEDRQEVISEPYGYVNPDDLYSFKQHGYAQIESRKTGYSTLALYSEPVAANKEEVQDNIMHALMWLYDACSDQGSFIPDSRYAAVTNAASVIDSLPPLKDGAQ